MVRWGQVDFDPEALSVVRSTYRPDIYRAALQPLGVTLPGANAKVEGALHAPTPVGSSTGQLELGPDGFFDGRIFDPDLVATYIQSLCAADRSA
jgi:NitT/TauT family transport system ATP-binding protein